MNVLTFTMTENVHGERSTAKREERFGSTVIDEKMCFHRSDDLTRSSRIFTELRQEDLAEMTIVTIHRYHTSKCVHRKLKIFKECSCLFEENED